VVRSLPRRFLSSVLRSLAAAAALALVALPATAATRAVPVFTFHMVDRKIPQDRIGNALTITPEQFEAQLRLLAHDRVHTITASTLVNDLRMGRDPGRAVVLTFDDGYANARTFVLPLLQRYHDTATFYVISSTIGTPRHLTWAGIRSLRAAGMEIGAHGTEHVDLTELDARGQLAQAQQCERALRRWANIVPATYAYPSGRYNATTLTVMRRAGLAAAFTEDYGYVHSLASPYRMPRIRVLRESAVPLFATVIGTLHP
jgi:peptidoglycan/xylan/chitin deacetylase (PgdA/CDA1 family)